MIEDADDAALADGASVEVLHAVLACQVDGLDSRDRIGNLSPLLARILHDVDLVSDKDLDRRLASTFALADPLLNPFEGLSLCNVKQVDDRRRAVDVLVHILMVALLARHVEVDDLVLIGIVDVKSRLNGTLHLVTYLDVQF